MAASALALGCGLFTAWFAIGDPDLGLHLALGRTMALHGEIPRADPFTYTTVGRPFINFEWGFDYAVYSLYQLAGAGGLLAAKLLIVITILLLVLKLAEQLFPENPSLARTCCALVLVAMLPVIRLRLVERPHLVGFTFFLAHLCLARAFLHSTSIFKRRLIFVSLVGSMPLWAAFHGSWPLALAVSGAHALLDPKMRRPMGWLFAAQVGAVVINPYNFELLWVPLRHLGSSEVGAFITEWMSPEFSLFRDHVPVVVAVAFAFVLTLIFLRHGGDLPELLVAAALILLATRSFRFLTPAFLVVAALMGARIAKLMQQTPSTLQRILGAGGLLLSLSIYAIFLPLQAQPILQGWGWEVKGLPRAAARTITDNNLPGPIFNDFDFGDDLCWTLGASVPHTIDGRVDLFGDKFLGDYVQFLDNPTKFSKHISEFNVQLVLLAYPTPRNQKLVAFLSESPEYALVHLDDTFALWARDRARIAARAKGLVLNRFTPALDIPQVMVGGADPELAAQLSRVADASDTRFGSLLRTEYWWRSFQQDPSKEQALEEVLDNTNHALTVQPSEVFAHIRRGQALLRLRGAWLALPDLLYAQAPHIPASMREDLQDAISALPRPLLHAFVQPLTTSKHP